MVCAMESKQDWNESCLKSHFLRYGLWHPYNAFRVLAGLNYESTEDEWDTESPLSNMINVPHEEYARYIQEMQSECSRLQNIWEHGKHGENETHPPKFFIDWAISIGHTPEWLEWAKEHGLYSPEHEAAQLAQIATAPALPLFDKDADNYPQELAAALQAWQAVSATEGKGKPKARIRAWLDTHETYKKLSDEAKERISIVVNWDKRGGATRSD